MPHIRVALMPAENLEFFALTDLARKDGVPTENRMFKMVRGAGDYKGAALNFDLTLEGARILALNVAPIILPIGISATIRKKMRPFEAKLTCDFSNGFEINGRADIKDGLVIYDNDITNKIHSKDTNTGNCQVEMIRGDLESAKLRAMHELEDRFESLRIHRTIMTRKDRLSYHEGILKDLSNNRAPKGQDKKRARRYLRWYQTLGGEAIVAAGLAESANFHWHTHRENSSSISTVKFEKIIREDGYKNMRMNLPTLLCLSFNKEKGTYDGCTQSQLDRANTPIDAEQAAMSSPACEEGDSVIDCGKKRAQNAVDLDFVPEASGGAHHLTL